MRILVTGAGGMLGHELVEAFADHEVTGTTHAQLDVTERAAVLDCFDALRPDVVLHGAAWTAVDACEADADRAWAVNALGTRYIAAPTASRSVMSPCTNEYRGFPSRSLRVSRLPA